MLGGKRHVLVYYCIYHILYTVMFYSVVPYESKKSVKPQICIFNYILL